MIPPILHRVAIGTPPPDAERWWAKFAKLHPTWQLITHTPEPEKFPRTAPLWPKCASLAQQADFMRYEVLARDGGVYVDWDVEPYQSFDPLLGLKGFAGCEAPDRTGNAVMGFEPGHPAVEAILTVAVAELEKPRPDAMSIGPLAVSRVCMGRDDVLILPPGTFYQMPWEERQKAEDGGYVRPWVYAVHRCHHSWGLPITTRPPRQEPQRTSLTWRQRQGLDPGPAKATSVPLGKIGAVIPTRFHPKQLEPLCQVLKEDGVEVIVQESEDFGHNIHKMWNDGVARLRAAGCTVVAILNDDIEMAPGTLAFMEKALRATPKTGVICCDTSPGRLRIKSRQRPQVPDRIRVSLSMKGTNINQEGFAFLYDPTDPDVPIFDETYHIWHGDIKFFDTLRYRGRAVGTAMGLVIVHETSHSTKRVLKTDNIWGDLNEQVAAGNADAIPFLEDVQRAHLERYPEEVRTPQNDVIDAVAVASAPSSA